MAKAKKASEPRKKKIKIDLSTLPPAIVEGRLIVKLKGKVYFERTLQGKTEIHEGELCSYDSDADHVILWDETRGQMYGFDMSQPPANFHAASESDLVESLEMIKLRGELIKQKMVLAVLEEKMGKLFVPVEDNRSDKEPSDEKKAS